MRTAAILAVLLLASAPPAAAQTNLTVLGVGRVAFEVALPPAEAQAQTYRFSMPAESAAKTPVAVTCAAPLGPTVCTFPLSVLPLVTTEARSLALSASIIGVDGELEGDKVVAPFVLRKGAPPVAVTWPQTPIRPPAP